MSEANTQNNQQAAGDEPVKNDANSTNGNLPANNTIDSTQTPPTGIPVSRFNEVNDRAKAAEAKLAERDAADRTAAEAKALKDGEYKTLLDTKNAELEASNKKAKEWDDYQASRRESLLSKIPEDQRALYNGVTLDSLEKLVETNYGATGPKPGHGEPGPGSTSTKGSEKHGGYNSMVEWQAADPKGYQEHRDKQAQSGYTGLGSSRGINIKGNIGG